MEINNTKEYTIELLKHYHDIIQDDFIRVTKTLYRDANDSLERHIILNTVSTLSTIIRHCTDDLIEHIEKDI